MSEIKITHPLLWGYPISQSFGENPDDYTAFGLKGHNGIDYACPVSTPVYAACDGQVTKIQVDPDGYGLHVRITHTWGRTIYAHLSQTAVNLGQTVYQGDMIGRSGGEPGSTFSGNSTGPHLHFEMRLDSEPTTNGYNGAVDPTPYMEQTTQTDPAQTIPESGKAVVAWPTLNIRSTANIAGELFGMFYNGAEIVYNAIIQDEGGDKWLQFEIFGNTLYCAAYYRGDWSVTIQS